MIKAPNNLKKWIERNSKTIIIILAFAIPFIVRAIPEILMGQFLVGFDSVGYYMPNTLIWLKNGVNLWPFLSSAPLFYLLLLGLTSAGAPIVILLKILPPMLLGFLGLAIFFYANKSLSWSYKKSLLAVPFATLYFVALRISWDMFRSELALIFLFLALILLQKKPFSLRNGIFLSVLLVLIVFSHQLVTIVVFAIIVATIARLAFFKKKTEIIKIVGFSVPAALLFLGVLYSTFVTSSIPALGFSGNFSSGFESLASASYSNLVFNTWGFLAFCYLPLLPFFAFGFRRFKSNFQLKAWIIWLFIPILFAFIPNAFFIGGILPYRWILLLIFPLAFYAAEGFCVVKWSWYKVAVAFIIAILSAGFLVFPNSGALNYFGSYPSYVPKSMLQNTIQLSDCQDTNNALVWARNNMPSNASLLTHAAFYGWATYIVDGSRLINYGFQDPVKAAQENSKSSNELYLIWWVNGTGWYGQTTLPESFKELYNSGNIAIYNYSASA